VPVPVHPTVAAWPITDLPHGSGGPARVADRRRAVASTDDDTTEGRAVSRLRRLLPTALLIAVVAIPLGAVPASAQAATGSISGTLTTAAGAPLADVAVTAHPAVHGRYDPYAITDSAGHYTLPALAPGDYKLEFYFDETLSSQWAHRAHDEDSAEPFTVTAGETTVVDEQRYPTGSASLTAVDAAGQPVTEFCVEAINKFLREACTDTGTALLTELPEGWYFFVVSPSDGSGLLFTDGTVVADQVTAFTAGA
jgi:hypothetical protein